MLVVAAHFHFCISSSCFGAFFTRVSYCSGVSSGSLRTNATTSQSSSSSWVMPQAGMPVIFTPCLTIQNCSAGVRSVLRRSSGARGYKPSTDLRPLHAGRKMAAAAHLRVLPCPSRYAVRIVQIIWDNDIARPGCDRAVPYRFKQPIDRLRVRHVSRNVVQASINPHRGGTYEHQQRACHQRPTPSGAHLFLRSLHGAVDVALASPPCHSWPSSVAPLPFPSWLSSLPHPRPWPECQPSTRLWRCRYTPHDAPHGRAPK